MLSAKDDWKPITGFDGYSVSKVNGVRNDKTKRILKGRSWNGYPKVTLMKNNKKFERRIHRLVGEEHVLNPNNLPILNHKDSNRGNYASSNLEWVNNSENQLHRWKTQKYMSDKPLYPNGYIKKVGTSLRARSKPMFVSQNEREALGIKNKSAVKTKLDKTQQSRLKKYRSYKEKGMGELRSRLNLALPFSHVIF